MRVLHVAVNFDKHEGMGRSIYEVAQRMGKESSMLCTNRVGRGIEVFEQVLEAGGSPSFFHFTRLKKIRAFVRKVNPDLIHIHGGILISLLALSAAFPGRKVLTIYSWHHLPPFRQLFSAWREVRSSQVLRARAVLSALLPLWLVRLCLLLGKIEGVLTPDPETYLALGPDKARLLRGGASVGTARARWVQQCQTVVFAGKAEMARGIDTILNALPAAIEKVPDLRLKLLLLPGPQVQDVHNLVRQMEIESSVEVKTEALSDLASEMARCQLGVFPFKYDYTTGIYPPLTVAEAMSVGLPIIYTKVRGLDGVLIEGQTGISVHVGDCEALARTIVHLLSDRELWEHLSEGARNAISLDWNWSNWIGTTRSLYQEALL